MKTLKYTVIIILVASCFGFVNIVAEKKSEKVASFLAAKDPKVDKIKNLSQQALREVISGIFNNIESIQSGKVNIVFKVSDKKRLEVLNVFGYNQQLVADVTEAITNTVILVPEATEGKYIISVVF